MIISNKYLVKNKDFKKIPSKILLNGIVNYINQDLNRVAEFDYLAENIDFKKLNRKELIQTYKKNTWLGKCSLYLTEILHKKVLAEGKEQLDESSEESNSDKSKSSGSNSDSKSDSETESISEEDDGEDYFPKSKLLKSDFKKKLHKWTNLKKKWKLIYRGTKDGFGANDFHKNCDNQGPTITIIKSNHGNIFGGFNKNPWSSNNQNTQSMENFLFSYKNKNSKKPIQIKSANSNTQYSAYNGSSYGPTFGGGHDLYICNSCNSVGSSYTNLGHTYTLIGYTYGQQNTKDYLAGSYNFTVIEIEVYKNLKK